MAAFGLHFGTCSACVAVYRDGKTDVIANDLGDRVTPCVVAFTDFEMSVGAAAKQGIIRNASNTVCHVKRLLGCGMDDPRVAEYSKKEAVNVVNHNGKLTFEVEHKGKPAKFSPTDITKVIYKTMLETAQSAGGSGTQDAVLAVPPVFDITQRNLVTQAATDAGFNVLRVITEPSAALLAFDVGQLDQTESFKTLVYRLGGTSHEAVVMDVEHGMFRMVAQISDTEFGGDVFTEKLQEFLMTEFQRQCRSDMRGNKRAVTKLGLAAERCKHTLSTLLTGQCAVDSLYDGCDFHYNMSRARFESLIQPLLPRCTGLIQQALTAAGCTKEDIAKLIICGGGAKPPVVKRAICDFLPGSSLLNSVPEDEIIAIGAAKQAALLVGGVESENLSVDKDSTLVNFQFLPKAVCVRAASGELEVVLPRHSLAPSRRQHTLTLPQAQTDVAMEIFQTDDPADMQAAELLAKLIMRDLPPGSTIKSNFHLKREGDLHITCHEVTSDRSETVTITCP